MRNGSTRTVAEVPPEGGLPPPENAFRAVQIWNRHGLYHDVEGWIDAWRKDGRLTLVPRLLRSPVYQGDGSGVAVREVQGGCILYLDREGYALERQTREASSGGPPRLMTKGEIDAAVLRSGHQTISSVVESMFCQENQFRLLDHNVRVLTARIAALESQVASLKAAAAPPPEPSAGEVIGRAMRW